MLETQRQFLAVQRLSPLYKQWPAFKVPLLKMELHQTHLAFRSAFQNHIELVKECYVDVHELACPLDVADVVLCLFSDLAFVTNMQRTSCLPGGLRLRCNVPGRPPRIHSKVEEHSRHRARNHSNSTSSPTSRGRPVHLPQPNAACPGYAFNDCEGHCLLVKVVFVKKNFFEDLEGSRRRCLNQFRRRSCGRWH